MTAAYPHIASRLFGRAHAIEPSAFRALIEGPIAKRILSGERPAELAETGQISIRRKRLAMIEADPVTVANGCGEYALTADGIAIVPIMGILSQRFDWLAALCGWTTYEGLAATFEAMLGDYRVRAILMDVESPGGEAAGMLDAADMILAARETKPVWAVANTFAASAAYALAGSAEVLFVPRLGHVGSIGAVCVHVDQSMADAAYGERYTAVYSGARKIDGWSHAPLSEGATSALQKGVDYCRDQFAELVGRQGRMTMAQAIATEAAMYHDAEAVDAGLADDVGSFEDALAELVDSFAKIDNRNPTSARARRNAQGETEMKTPNRATETSVAALSLPPAASAPAPASAAPASPPPAAPAAAAEAAPAAGRADLSDDDEPKKPGPGEVCATCGQTMPGEKEGAHVPVPAVVDASAEVTVILDLCATQGLSAAAARGFVAAKTPLADVRAKIAATKAAEGDRLQTVATRDSNFGEDEAIKASWKAAHERVRASMKSATAS